MSAGDDTSPRAEGATSSLPPSSSPSHAIDPTPPPSPPATDTAAAPVARAAQVLTDVADLFAPIEVDAPSRLAFLLRVAAHVAAVVFAIVIIARTIRPLTSPHAPPPLPGTGTEGTRFGLSLDKRHAIFSQIAATEAYSRRMGTQGFPTQPWSAEDHRCAYERDAVRGTAARFGLDLSTTYLIFDEGIRSHWPGPDGTPLVATTVPLDPRRE